MSTKKQVDRSKEIQKRMNKEMGFILLAAIGAAFVITLNISKRIMTYEDKKIYWCYLRLELLSKETTLCRIGESEYTFSKNDFSTKLKPTIERAQPKYIILAVSFVVLFIGFIFIFIWLFGNRFKRKMEKKFIKGARIVSNDDLKRELKRDKKESEITIGDVPIVEGSETTHFTISGSTGSGKSVAMKEIMDYIRNKKQKAIIYDPSGEFVEAYYREGKDIIINPYDARSVAWNILLEIKEEFHIKSIAAAIVPDNPNAKEKIWDDGPRSILASIIETLLKKKLYDQTAIYKLISLGTIHDIYKFIQGTPGAKHVHPENEKMAVTHQQTLDTKCEFFKHMKTPKDGEEYFSLDDYMRNDDDDRWIFLRIEQTQLEALKSLVSLFFDMASNILLTLQPDKERRIWFFIDELSSLPKMDKLQAILDKGRKYGACCVLGYQAISQLNEIYGKERTKSMLSNTKTWCVYNSPEYDTAKWLSQNLGSEEFLEGKISESISNNKDGQSTSTSISYDTKKKEIVMPEEIQYLPPLTAYLKLAGHYPVTKLELTWKDREKIAEKYVRAS